MALSAAFTELCFHTAMLLQVFDKAICNSLPFVTRWFQNCVHQPALPLHIEGGAALQGAHGRQG